MYSYFHIIQIDKTFIELAIKKSEQIETRNVLKTDIYRQMKIHVEYYPINKSINMIIIVSYFVKVILYMYIFKERLS